MKVRPKKIKISQIAKMKKQFLITKISKHLFYAMLVAIFFCGCVHPDPIEKGDILRIDNIEITNTYEAVYTITSRDKANRWGIRVTWIDSIGKFNVGDTVIIAKKHCH